MKINMRAWKNKVSHHCLHALLVAGYCRPKDIAFVRVSRLLQIPDIDANDVAAMLSALYDSTFKRGVKKHPPLSFGLPKEGLATVVREICRKYHYDEHPEKLVVLTAIELLRITDGDMIVLAQMVRKIKHFMMGKPDPEEMLHLPSM